MKWTVSCSCWISLQGLRCLGVRVEGGMAMARAWARMRRAQLKRVEGFDGDALSRDGDAFMCVPSYHLS
jgi:hypothetical protein